MNRYVSSGPSDEYDELEQHIAEKLGTPLDWPEDGGLTARRVVKIAAAATCDTAYSQAANGHLIDLFAALPLPGTVEGESFWERIGDAGGSAALYIDPANMGGPFFDRAHDSNEGAIASRLLSFTEALTPPQRAAVAEVVGSALDEGTIGVGGRYAGELWLRDAEISAWHVLLASSRRSGTAEDRERFFEAWRRA